MVGKYCGGMDGGNKAQIILGQVILIRSKIMACINIYQNLHGPIHCVYGAANMQ